MVQELQVISCVDLIKCGLHTYYSYELLLTHVSFTASSVNCKHIVFNSSWCAVSR